MDRQINPEYGSDSFAANAYLVCQYYKYTVGEVITRTLLDEYCVLNQRNHFEKVNNFPFADYLSASEEPSEDDQKEAEEAPLMPQPPIPSEEPSENKEKKPNKDKNKKHSEDEQNEAEEAPVMPRPPTP